MVVVAAVPWGLWLFSRLAGRAIGGIDACAARWQTLGVVLNVASCLQEASMDILKITPVKYRSLKLGSVARDGDPRLESEHENRGGIL